MSDLFVHMPVFILACIGFALLACATARQQEDIFGRELGRRATACLRLGGWLALAATLAVAVGALGWPMGLVAYSGHTSLGAGAVCVTLLVRARKPSPQRLR